MCERALRVVEWELENSVEVWKLDEASVKEIKLINTALYRPLHSHQLSGQRMKQEFFTAAIQHTLRKKNKDMK